MRAVGSVLMALSCMRGNLFVVVAPSGAGKTSLVAALMREEPNIRLSISHTTRAPRQGEANGREYHFVDRAAFEKMISEDRKSTRLNSSHMSISYAVFCLKKKKKKKKK